MATLLSVVLARFHPQFEDFHLPAEEATPDVLHPSGSSQDDDSASSDQDGLANLERRSAASLGESIVKIDIPDENLSPGGGAEEEKDDTPPGLSPPLQAAPRLTRLIREQRIVVRCVALAPPMILSRNLAQSSLALTVVTSIVFGHVSPMHAAALLCSPALVPIPSPCLFFLRLLKDMICRLSLRNVWLLKEQMIRGFRRMARGTSRWRAWRHNMRRRHSALLLPEQETQILQEQGETNGASSAAEPDPISSDPGSNATHPGTAVRVRRPSFLTPRVCDQHLTGRIYHFHPDRRQRKGNFCSTVLCHSCCGPEYSNTVFRSHPDAYQGRLAYIYIFFFAVLFPHACLGLSLSCPSSLILGVFL